MNKGVLFHHVAVDIGGGVAIPETRDYEHLVTQEKKKIPDNDVCESAKSTTDEDDYTGWDSEIQSGYSQVPYFGTVLTHHNFWVKKRSKTSKTPDVVITRIPSPIPRTWAKKIEPLWQPGEEEEKNTKFDLRTHSHVNLPVNVGTGFSIYAT